MITRLRPSSLEAIEACPGRAFMEEQVCQLVPALDDITSEAAQQGTWGHEVLASIAKEAFIGDWSGADAVIAGIEPRMTHLELWCKDAVRSCLTYLLGLLRRLTSDGYHVQVLAETHLDGTHLGIPRGGTADLILLVSDRDGRLIDVHIIDWKCGFVYQGEAADHLQLGTYAAMAAKRWDRAKRFIVHLAMGRRREFSSALYQAPELAAISHRIRGVVSAATAQVPVITPSLKACRYCKALPLCRKARLHLDGCAVDADLFDDITPADKALARRFIAATEDLKSVWCTTSNPGTDSPTAHLFGTDPANRIALADACAIYKRFAATTHH